MRHKRRRGKLNRSSSARKALLRNLAKSFLEYEKIKTTTPKAKELKSWIERLITLAKVDTVHRRRLVFAQLNDFTLVKKIFTQIAPQYKEREGGYTRVIPVGFRRGDNAEMALIELVKEGGGGEKATHSKEEKK